MSFLGALSDVEVAGADPQRICHCLLLVRWTGAGEVEMHAVRPHLLRAAGDEPEAELRVVAGHERPTGDLNSVTVEQSRPEPRQLSGVLGVTGQSQQLRGHPRTLDAGRSGDNPTKPLDAVGHTADTSSARNKAPAHTEEPATDVKGSHSRQSGRHVPVGLLQPGAPS